MGRHHHHASRVIINLWSPQCGIEPQIVVRCKHFEIASTWNHVLKHNSRLTFTTTIKHILVNEKRLLMYWRAIWNIYLPWKMFRFFKVLCLPVFHVALHQQRHQPWIFFKNFFRWKKILLLITDHFIKKSFQERTFWSWFVLKHNSPQIHTLWTHFTVLSPSQG